MRVWRISKANRVRDLTGYGASIDGGRWNQQDVCAVYAGLSPAICCLETFVHQTHMPLIPMKIVCLELPDDPSLYLEPPVAGLPAGWNALPADRASMDFGTAWLRAGNQLGLIVPSAVMTLEKNIVINPTHRDMSLVRIVDEQDFRYDDRMFSVRA